MASHLEPDPSWPSRPPIWSASPFRGDSGIPHRFSGSFPFLTTLTRLLSAVTAASRPRFPMPQRRTRDIQGLTPVFRVFSSTLLPGFSGPESSVLPVDLPPSDPSPLRDLLVRFRFYDLYSSSRDQVRRASLGKTQYLPIFRPASHRFDSPDIRPRLATTARPSPQRHIAGSLFATYMGSASCFLQTAHFWYLPLPCWRCPSVR